MAEAGPKDGGLIADLPTYGQRLVGGLVPVSQCLLQFRTCDSPDQCGIAVQDRAGVDGISVRGPCPQGCHLPGVRVVLRTDRAGMRYGERYMKGAHPLWSDGQPHQPLRSASNGSPTAGYTSASPLGVGCCKRCSTQWLSLPYRRLGPMSKNWLEGEGG